MKVIERKNGAKKVVCYEVKVAKKEMKEVMNDIVVRYNGKNVLMMVS